MKCEYCGDEIYYGAHVCQEEINALRSDLAAANKRVTELEAELKRLTIPAPPPEGETK